MYNRGTIQEIDNRPTMTQVIEYNENNYSDFEWFEGFAVIRFYADWCKPCVQNFPVFNELPAQYAESKPESKFGKVKIDQPPVLTLRYHVYGLPSRLIFKNGTISKRIAGAKSLTEIKTILSQSLTDFSE